jgi:sulfatase modifying factor 1
MRLSTWLFVLAAGTGLAAQAPTHTNSVEMQFVRIEPGTMRVGRFNPPYAVPSPRTAGRSLYAEVMAAGDSDGDLLLSAGEFTALAGRWFAGMDGATEDRVSREQFVAAFAAMQPMGRGFGGGGRAAAVGPAPTGPAGAGGRAGAGRGGGGGVGGASIPLLFAALDQSADGTLTRAEMTSGFQSWFELWDTRGSGRVTSNQVLKGFNSVLPSVPAATGGRGGSPLTADEYARIEAHAKRDSLPGFEVRIERAYYIGKYEITQAQWRRVMRTNPSVHQGQLVGGINTDNFPVDNVTWNDAQSFVRRLNELERTDTYRLPTEFEWEYAARAGAEDGPTAHDLRQIAVAFGPRQPSPVGSMKPNAWGLYDTVGNVWEWVQDFYNDKFFADPTPPKSGQQHVLKGGGFISDLKNASYTEHGGGPGSGFDNGFRIVKDIR